MPELPDLLVYVKSLERLLIGEALQSIVIRSPFVLRTHDPPLESIVSKQVIGFSRCGKRIVWHLEDQTFLVFHLMIAGRFHWSKERKLPRGKIDLLAIQFPIGTMMLTEASSKKRAGLWVVRGIENVEAMNPGGLDLLKADLQEFQMRIQKSNLTLKRALSDPKLFDGIGNAYGDEILHAAKLSPFKQTLQLDEHEMADLYHAARRILESWTSRLFDASQGKFPEKVTAFRPEMMVHGKFGQRCGVCNAPIQRIRYAENECNYCPGCQTNGRILADRSLSRLLKDEWPKTLEELEGE